MQNFSYYFKLILFVTFFCINALQAQNLSFSIDSVLNVAQSPEALLSGDFNNDEAPDLAIAIRNESIGHHIAIFLNDGTGIFKNAPDSIYQVGDFPRGISTGDFNNDNIPDLATTNYNDSTITLLFGIGDGTFGNADSLDVPSKGEDIIVSDFNNDQNDDLAVITRYSQLFIYKGNGDSTFLPPVLYSAGGTGADIEAYDMNKDNYIDLIVGLGNTSSLSLLLNDGTGDFSNRRSIYTTRPPWSVQACDFNSDAYPDIAVGSGSWDFDNVIALLGDTLGNYTVSDTASSSSYVDHISVNDLNNDGKTDILV